MILSGDRFYLANSVDCLEKYSFRGFPNTKGYTNTKCKCEKSKQLNPYFITKRITQNHYKHLVIFKIQLSDQSWLNSYIL